MDRLRYEVFHRLWVVWHMRLPRFKPFMAYVPKKSYGFVNGRELFEPAQRWHWACYHGHSRPWWHMCCNGDAGGWRTKLCDYLEHRWRATDYYTQR